VTIAAEDVAANYDGRMIMTNEADAMKERENERLRERRIHETKSSELSDEDLGWLLHRRYDAPVIPPCHICGGKLSVQRCGGGEPTVYACDGRESTFNWQPGRNLVDEHYRNSHFEDRRQGGDEHVIELLTRYEKGTP
jgi:hypothetical protein